MKSLERNIVDCVLKYKNFIFLLVVTFLGLWARLSMYSHISGDMVSFLIPWMDEFTEGGFKALANQVGDYNLPYQFIIYLLSLIPGETAYKVKTVSVIFDVLLSYAVMDLITTLDHKKEFGAKAVIGYAITFFLPVVIFNSAAWGQCDVIYTFFLVLSLSSLFKEKPKMSFFFFGVALSFKLQAVFALPFVIILYFRDKKFSIVNVLYTILGLYIPSVPAIIAGRGIFSPITVYMNQTGEYPYMWLNFPSFWNLITVAHPGYDFIGGGYDKLKVMAVGITVVLLGILFLYELSKERNQESFSDDWLLLVITVLVSVYFLPSMHERYSYFLDVALIVLMLQRKTMLPLAVACFAISSLTYGHYLFGVYYNIMFCAIVYLVVLAIMIFVYIRRGNNGRLEEL